MPAALRNNITSKVPPAGPRSLATMASKKPVVIGTGWSASKAAQGTTASTEQSSAKKQKRNVTNGATDSDPTSQPAESTAGASSEPNTASEFIPAPPPSPPPPSPPPPAEEPSSGSRWKPVATHDYAPGLLQGVQSKVEPPIVNGIVHVRKYTHDKCGDPAPRISLSRLSLPSSAAPESLAEVPFPSPSSFPAPAPSFAAPLPSFAAHEPSSIFAGAPSSSTVFDPALAFPTPSPSFSMGSTPSTVVVAPGPLSTLAAGKFYFAYP